MVSLRILLSSAGLLAALAPAAAFAHDFVFLPQVHVHLGAPPPQPVYAPAPVFVPAPVVVVRQPLQVAQPMPIGTTSCPGPVMQAGWMLDPQSGMRTWVPAHCAPYAQPVQVFQPAPTWRHDHGRHEGWYKHREHEWHEHGRDRHDRDD
jgi:hypothetical protein